MAMAAGVAARAGRGRGICRLQRAVFPHKISKITLTNWKFYLFTSRIGTNIFLLIAGLAHSALLVRSYCRIVRIKPDSINTRIYTKIHINNLL